jgi:hypothetical protein
VRVAASNVPLRTEFLGLIRIWIINIYISE